VQRWQLVATGYGRGGEVPPAVGGGGHSGDGGSGGGVTVSISMKPVEMGQRGRVATGGGGESGGRWRRQIWGP
jgi:hypothetical protein